MDLFFLGGRASLLILGLVAIECLQHVGELLNLGLDGARQLSVGGGGDLHGLEFALGLQIVILKVKIFLCDLRDLAFYLTEMVAQWDYLLIIFRGILLTFFVDWSFVLFFRDSLFLSKGCNWIVILFGWVSLFSHFSLLGLGCFLIVFCLLGETLLLGVFHIISRCSFLLLQSWLWHGFSLCLGNGRWIALNLLWLDGLIAFFFLEVVCGGDILDKTSTVNATSVSSDLWLWARAHQLLLFFFED